jgi:hypothetical protein
MFSAFPWQATAELELMRAFALRLQDAFRSSRSGGTGKRAFIVGLSAGELACGRGDLRSHLWKLALPAALSNRPQSIGVQSRARIEKHHEQPLSVRVARRGVLQDASEDLRPSLLASRPPPRVSRRVVPGFIPAGFLCCRYSMPFTWSALERQRNELHTAERVDVKNLYTFRIMCVSFPVERNL